jgi:hypothetical protein
MNVLFAMLGSKFLAVPLFLPFGSTDNDIHHYVFALIGFGLEFAYMCAACYEVYMKPGRAKGVKYVYATYLGGLIALVLLGTSLLPFSSTGYRRVAIIISEYLFGASLLGFTMSCYYYRLY